MSAKKRDVSISFRTTKEFKSLVDILSDKLMISKTAVITMAITELASKENVLEDDTVFLNMEELAAEVGKQFAADLNPLADAIATMASSVNEMQTRLEKLESTKKSRSRQYYKDNIKEIAY